MKAIFIAFDQAYYERIVETLPRLGCRGFTAWQEVQGRGTESPEVIEERLRTARKEHEYESEFDYIVINDDVDRAAAEVLSIISDIKSK